MKFDLLQVERLIGGWIMGHPKDDKTQWRVYVSFEDLKSDLTKFMTEDKDEGDHR